MRSAAGRHAVMSDVCQTNEKAYRPGRDAGSDQFGGNATLLSTTMGTGRRLTFGLFTIVAFLSLLVDHAVPHEVVGTRGGHLAVGASNEGQLVSRRDAQGVRGRMNLLGVSSTTVMDARRAPAPEV